MTNSEQFKELMAAFNAFSKAWANVVEETPLPEGFRLGKQEDATGTPGAGAQESDYPRETTVGAMRVPSDYSFGVKGAFQCSGMQGWPVKATVGPMDCPREEHQFSSGYPRLDSVGKPSVTNSPWSEDLVRLMDERREALRERDDWKNSALRLKKEVDQKMEELEEAQKERDEARKEGVRLLEVVGKAQKERADMAQTILDRDSRLREVQGALLRTTQHAEKQACDLDAAQKERDALQARANELESAIRDRAIVYVSRKGDDELRGELDQWKREAEEYAGDALKLREEISLGKIARGLLEADLKRAESVRDKVIQEKRDLVAAARKGDTPGGALLEYQNRALEQMAGDLDAADRRVRVLEAGSEDLRREVDVLRTQLQTESTTAYREAKLQGHVSRARKMECERNEARKLVARKNKQCKKLHSEVVELRLLLEAARDTSPKMNMVKPGSMEKLRASMKATTEEEPREGGMLPKDIDSRLVDVVFKTLKEEGIVPLRLVSSELTPGVRSLRADFIPKKGE